MPGLSARGSRRPGTEKMPAAETLGNSTGRVEPASEKFGEVPTAGDGDAAALSQMAGEARWQLASLLGREILGGSWPAPRPDLAPLSAIVACGAAMLATAAE